MIALNVERMVNAFTGDKSRSASAILNLELDNGESADSLFLTEQARIARLSGSVNEAFCEQHADSVKTSPAFALEYAKFLYESQRYNDVITILQHHDHVEMAVVRARALIAAGKAEEARNMIGPI